MSLYDVVTKLIGPTKPIGSTEVDNLRFENLKELTELTEQLLADVRRIAIYNKGRQEFSIKRSAEFCEEFLREVGLTP